MVLHEALEGRRRQTRHVAVQDQHVAFEALESRGRGSDGVAGSPLLDLPRIGDRSRDRAAARGTRYRPVRPPRPRGRRRSPADPAQAPVAVSSTDRMKGFPAIACRTLARSDRIRVPRPAARTTIPNCGLAAMRKRLLYTGGQAFPTCKNAPRKALSRRLSGDTSREKTTADRPPMPPSARLRRGRSCDLPHHASATTRHSTTPRTSSSTRHPSMPVRCANVDEFVATRDARTSRQILVLQTEHIDREQP